MTVRKSSTGPAPKQTNTVLGKQICKLIASLVRLCVIVSKSDGHCWVENL